MDWIRPSRLGQWGEAVRLVFRSCWLGGGALALVLAAGLILWQRRSIREASVVRQAFQRGRYETAGEALERWLRTSPNSAAAQFWRARIALATRRPQEAAEALQQAEALGEDPRRLKTLRASPRG